MKNKILMLIPAFIYLFLAGCGGNDIYFYGHSGQDGQVEVTITDAATADYKAVYVTIKEVAVQKANSETWIVLSEQNTTYNLLELVNGVREELALADLEEGHYTQMRLILGNTPDNSLNIQSVKHPYANYFINDKNKSIALKVASGFETGIKIVKGFDISGNETTELILDFDAARSIVKAGNSGKWLLKPAIKMLDTEESSIIQGNAGMEGILVSAQIYDATAETSAMVQVAASTITDEDGGYKLFLEPGTYTLVGYKDGYYTYYKNSKIVVTAGNTYTENFSIGDESPSGFLAGNVTISEAEDEQHATFSIRQAATVNGNDEQIEVKSLNVENGGSFSTNLPVEDHTAVISTFGKTTIEKTFSITAEATTNLGTIAF